MSSDGIEVGEMVWWDSDDKKYREVWSKTCDYHNEDHEHNYNDEPIERRDQGLKKEKEKS